MCHFLADNAISSSLLFSANKALSVLHRCSPVTDYKRTIWATPMLPRDGLQTHYLCYINTPPWRTTNALYVLHQYSSVTDYKRTICATPMLPPDRLQTHYMGYTDTPPWRTTNALSVLHRCSPVTDYKRTIWATPMLTRDGLQTHYLCNTDALPWPTTNAFKMNIPCTLVDRVQRVWKCASTISVLHALLFVYLGWIVNGLVGPLSGSLLTVKTVVNSDVLSV